MMLVDDVCNAALARCAEFSARIPSARSVMCRRINARQQQLFSHIADQEPEYFGRSEVITLGSNEYDLALLDPQAERVTYVEIGEVTTSSHAPGERVAVVPIMDVGAELAPRCTIRDFFLKGVDDTGTNDLDGVTSLVVHHSKRAATIDETTQTTELPDQFDELLVIDLAYHLMRKAPGVEADVRKLALATMKEEETELMGDLDRHLEHWRYAEVARSGHSQKATLRPSR